MECVEIAEDHPEVASHLPSKLEQPDASHDENPQERHVSCYRCKKCRIVVAAQESVVDHRPGVGQEAFRWRKRGGGSSSGEVGTPQCSSIFVEPMRWMKSVEGVTEGKLSCVKCEARLGRFNWAGFQCNCGAWVTPAFQLHKSRIDAVYHQ